MDRLEGIKERIIEEFKFLDVDEPSMPSQVALGMCSNFNSCCLEPLSIREVSQDSMLAGRLDMMKEG